jgi:PmbA protein
MMHASEILKEVMKEGFDEAVVSARNYNSIYLKIANYKVDSIVEKNGTMGSLYVTKGKRIAFTNIEKLEMQSVRASIENIKRALENTKPKEDYFGIASGKFKYRSKSIYDSKIADAGPDEVASLANDLISRVKASNLAGTLYLTKWENELATSNGVDASAKSTAARLSMRIFKGDFSIQDTVASKRLSGIDIRQILKSAELIEYIKTKSKIKAGTYDIIYSRPSAGALLSMANTMACMGNVESGSFFTSKMGGDVANKDLSLYDDGSAPEGVASSPFDDEGYPTQKTKFVENGKLVKYLHNYSTAKKYNTKSTGNAGLVNPEPNMLVVEHRKKQGIDALISSIDRGILVTNVWYTRFSNYLTGDFSTMPRDLAIYIEKGSPLFAIKQIEVGSGIGIRISDNMIRMMKNITRVGDDSAQSTSWETIGTYYFTPSILTEKVNVSTA